MPNDKQDIEAPQDKNAVDEKKRRAALVNAIRGEMDELSPEELERLYVAIALMEMKKDK